MEEICQVFYLKYVLEKWTEEKTKNVNVKRKEALKCGCGENIKSGQQINTCLRGKWEVFKEKIILDLWHLGKELSREFNNWIER